MEMFGKRKALKDFASEWRSIVSFPRVAGCRVESGADPRGVSLAWLFVFVHQSFAHILCGQRSLTTGSLLSPRFPLLLGSQPPWSMCSTLNFTQYMVLFGRRRRTQQSQKNNRLSLSHLRLISVECLRERILRYSEAPCRSAALKLQLLFLWKKRSVCNEARWTPEWIQILTQSKEMFYKYPSGGLKSDWYWRRNSRRSEQQAKKYLFLRGKPKNR